MGYLGGLSMERNPADVASTIHVEVAELSILARASKLDTLGFLLEMTLIEAIRVKKDLQHQARVRRIEPLPLSRRTRNTPRTRPSP